MLPTLISMPQYFCACMITAPSDVSTTGTNAILDKLAIEHMTCKLGLNDGISYRCMR